MIDRLQRHLLPAACVVLVMRPALSDAVLVLLYLLVLVHVLHWVLVLQGIGLHLASRDRQAPVSIRLELRQIGEVLLGAEYLRGLFGNRARPYGRQVVGQLDNSSHTRVG